MPQNNNPRLLTLLRPLPSTPTPALPLQLPLQTVPEKLPDLRIVQQLSNRIPEVPDTTVRSESIHTTAGLF